MNKIIVTLIAIIVVFTGIFTAIVVLEQNKVNEEPKVETDVAEEILDECTDEYEEIQYENTVKANTEEEKTSPNCSLIIKTYYKNCEHTKQQYNNLSKEEVNLTEEEIQGKYKEYEIESFASNEIILYQEKSGECGEHYLIKDRDGVVVIYRVLEDGTKEEYEETGISTEYLPETDKINMENGIQVNGKQELYRLIEDFE